MMSAYCGHVEVVRYLLGIRAVRATSSIDNRNRDIRRRTALWRAVDRGHEEVVKLLVEAGASPVVAASDGVTPTDIAQRYGHHQCVSYCR